VEEIKGDTGKGRLKGIGSLLGIFKCGLNNTPTLASERDDKVKKDLRISWDGGLKIYQQVLCVIPPRRSAEDLSKEDGRAGIHPIIFSRLNSPLSPPLPKTPSFFGLF
jgi:hypothetical protein